MSFNKDRSRLLGRTIRYEPRRVAQDVNVEGISKAYSSEASRVSITWMGVTFKTELLDMNPVGLPRT